MAFIAIAAIVLIIVWWIIAGYKERRLYNNLEDLLIHEYGWTSDKFYFLWKRYEKEIIGMQSDGMSEEEIAKELNENFRNTYP